MLRPEPARPVEESDGGRTQAEIRSLLGEQDYARYLASHLTLAGFMQRQHGDHIALEGGLFALAAAAIGVPLVLTATEATRWRAVVGYCVIAVGIRIGGGVARYGFVMSMSANVTGPRAAFRVGGPDVAVLTARPASEGLRPCA